MLTFPVIRDKIGPHIIRNQMDIGIYITYTYMYVFKQNFQLSDFVHMFMNIYIYIYILLLGSSRRAFIDPCDKDAVAKKLL